MKKDTIKVHCLKTINPYFQDVWDGKKNFEFRFDDRGYKVGDSLELREYEPKTKTYSGRFLRKVIVYILDDNFEGIESGFCILGIQ